MKPKIATGVPCSQLLGARRGNDEDHWALLALTRFGLALWVLFAHSMSFCPASRNLPVIDGNAIVAVYCFFAISGYSICHSVEKNSSGYWFRRFWRIAPVYLTCFLLATCAYLFSPDAHKTLYTAHEVARVPGFVTFIGAAFLLQSIVPIIIGAIFPAWSLSIEVVYYTTALMLKKTSLAVLLILFIASGLFCAYRVRYLGGYLGVDTHGISLVGMYWAWLSGWLAYRCRHKLWFSLSTAAMGVLIILVDPLHYPGVVPTWIGTVIADSLLWCGTLALLFHVDNLNLNKILSRSFSYLGEISYPLYLVHYPLMFLIYNRYFIHNPTYDYPALMILFAFTASALIYHFIDHPLRRGGRNWILGVFILLNLTAILITSPRSFLAFGHRLLRLF